MSAEDGGRRPPLQRSLCIPKVALSRRTMDMRAFVSTVTPVSEAPSTVASSAPPAPARTVPQVATTLELLLVYSGILLYIWRWQTTHPRAWAPLLAVEIGRASCRERVEIGNVEPSLDEQCGS